MSKICHRLVHETAKGIAAESWEILSSNDHFHKCWPDVNRFVRRHWKDFVGHARVILVKMLTDPGAPEWKKEAIYEALLLEGAGKATPLMMASAANTPTPRVLH